MNSPDAVSTFDNGGTDAASVMLTTPPDWRSLDLDRLTDTSWMNSLLAARIETPADESSDPAEALAKMVGGVAEQGIVFVAVYKPDDGGSVDFSAVTLALRHPHDSNPPSWRETAKATNGAGQEADDRIDSAKAHRQPGASQNAVLLPAGPAARLESLDTVEIGEPFKPVPVFCVEYGLAVPNDERMAILTFTTIAPSDIDALRVQFAEIAETLAFS